MKYTYWGILLVCLIFLSCGFARKKENFISDVSFGGYVSYESSNSGVFFVEGALVQIKVGDHVVLDTMTNKEGEYEFNTLPLGVFNLSISHRNFQEFDLKNLVTSKVVNTRLHTEMSFLPTVVRGRVIMKPNKVAEWKAAVKDLPKHLAGASIIPVWNATINTSPPTVKTTPDSSGYYILNSSKFEPGINYTIQARHLSFQVDMSEPITPILEKENSIPEIELIPFTKVKGVKEGTPVYNPWAPGRIVLCSGMD